jgi:hemolysin III
MSETTSGLSKPPDSVPIPKPLLRGRLHQLALLLAVPAGVRLVIIARSGSARAAMIIYALSLVGLFGTSAAYHRLKWSPRSSRILRSLDHSMIFVLIAGTYTAFADLVLTGLWQVLVLVVVWTGALAGITLKLINIDRFSFAGGTLYIALGWIGIAALPPMLSNAEILPLVLTLAGGLMYTFGTLVLLRRRPDPNPRVFGYHEVWHTVVIAASACHYVAITLLIPTSG